MQTKIWTLLGNYLLTKAENTAAAKQNESSTPPGNKFPSVRNLFWEKKIQINVLLNKYYFKIAKLNIFNVCKQHEDFHNHTKIENNVSSVSLQIV